MHVLWKIFGMRFEWLVHGHVKVGVQVSSLGGWRSITCSSKTLRNDSLVIGLFLTHYKGVEKLACLNSFYEYMVIISPTCIWPNIVAICVTISAKNWFNLYLDYRTY